MTQVRDESDNADRVPDDSDHTETDISTEPPAKEEVTDLVIQDGCLVRYNGSESKVEIPSAVTSISPHAFSGCQTIQEVTIPDEVTVISNGAHLKIVQISKR